MKICEHWRGNQLKVNFKFFTKWNRVKASKQSQATTECKWATLRTTVFYFLDSSSLFLCPSVSLHSQLRQSLLLLMCTIHKFPRQFFRAWCWFCVDVSVFSINFEWIVHEFDWNPTMQDFYTWAFIESTSKWTSSPFTENFAYSFIYAKRKTCFRASLSREKHRSWHLGLGNTLCPQLLCLENALHLTLFTNSFIYLHFLLF